MTAIPAPPSQEEAWQQRKDRSLIETLVEVARSFLRWYPRDLFLATFLLLIGGMLEGIGILALLPLLDILVGDPESTNRITEVYREAMDFLGLEMTLGTVLALIVGLVTAKSLFMLSANLYIANTSARITKDFRLLILRALMRVRWQFFTGEPIGRITNSILQEAESASAAARGLMLLASYAIQLLIYLGTALLISWKLTLAGILGGLVIMLALRVFVEMTRRQGARMTELNRTYTSRIVDFFLSLKPLKAMGREDQIAPFLEQETRQLLATQRKLNFASTSVDNLQEPFAAIFVAVGVFVAIQYFSFETTSLLIMVALFARTVGRISGLLQALKKLARVEAPFFAFTSKLASIREQAEAVAEERPDAQADFASTVEFRDVGFTYDEKSVLKELSLTIKAGEVTAILGPSGAGKSTFLDLLVGLLEPTAGSIRVDGEDLRRRDRLAWRRLLGYVPQDTTLFHATIMENLTLADASISEADVERALRDAGAWDFVAAMPKGLHEVVGERGLKISGGQRQRLAIARALVHKPKLLLLDEATSALDGETERAFYDTLERLTPGVTIVAITHRPAIKEIADVVYALDDGRARQVTSGRVALENEVSGATAMGLERTS